MLSLKELRSSSKEGKTVRTHSLARTTQRVARCWTLKSAAKVRDEFTPKTLTCLFQSAHTGRAFIANVARSKSRLILPGISRLCAFMRPQYIEAYDISAPFFVGLHMASAG